jgi:hypothetical protein
MFHKGNIPPTGKFSYHEFTANLIEDLGTDAEFNRVTQNCARYRTRPLIERLSAATEITNFSQRQIAAIFQKNISCIDKSSDDLLRKEASSSFLKNEEANARYNSANMHSLLCKRVIDKAQGVLSSILLHPPKIRDLNYHWGPGSTATVRRPYTEPYFKYANQHITGSEDVFREFSFAMLDRRFSRQQYFTVLEHDQLTTVPKSYKAKRTISIAPDLNIYAQLGVGSAISSRLAVHEHLNITDIGQARQRALAREGSITGAYATLDLKSASDRLPLGLISDLFQSFKYSNLRAWWRLFLASGCHSYELDGVVRKYEMIAPMGNGYTFGLMSLVYYSLLRGYAQLIGSDSVITAYGDDIIVSSDFARNAVYLLQKFGFVINEQKSYITGPFRESCGGDYLNGIDVRPVYLKSTPNCIQDYFSLINRLRSKRHLCSFTRTTEYLISKIPVRYRFYGPPSEDVRKHIFVSGTFEECSTKVVMEFQRLGVKGIEDKSVFLKDAGLDEYILYFMSLAAMDAKYTPDYFAKPLYQRELQNRPANRITDPLIRHSVVKVT